MIEWGTRNSHRLDVKLREGGDRFGRNQLTEVLAPDERAVERWNSNPYRPDFNGNGSSEDDGAYFLLPYWMGRDHGWVKGLFFSRVGTSRCDAPARVQRAERISQQERTTADVAPLYAARTAQRAVPTTLNASRGCYPRLSSASPPD